MISFRALYKCSPSLESFDCRLFILKQFTTNHYHTIVFSVVAFIQCQDAGNACVVVMSESSAEVFDRL